MLLMITMVAAIRNGFLINAQNHARNNNLEIGAKDLLFKLCESGVQIIIVGLATNKAKKLNAWFRFFGYPYPYKPSPLS